MRVTLFYGNIMFQLKMDLLSTFQWGNVKNLGKNAEHKNKFVIIIVQTFILKNIRRKCIKM